MSRLRSTWRCVATIIKRMRSSRLHYVPLRMTFLWDPYDYAAQRLRMTFCWFEDANADEILTTTLRNAWGWHFYGILTTPLRSAQDDKADEILTTTLRNAWGWHFYEILRLRSGWHNKDEILTTPLHSAQDDITRNRSSRLHFVPLRMTFLWDNNDDNIILYF